MPNSGLLRPLTGPEAAGRPGAAGTLAEPTSEKIAVGIAERRAELHSRSKELKKALDVELRVREKSLVEAESRSPDLVEETRSDRIDLHHESNRKIDTILKQRGLILDYEESLDDLEMQGKRVERNRSRAQMAAVRADVALSFDEEMKRRAETSLGNGMTEETAERVSKSDLEKGYLRQESIQRFPRIRSVDFEPEL